MKPNDTFYFLSNNVVTVGESLSSLYQPIMGGDAFVVYTYLVARFDHGRARHRMTDLLNQVQFGFDRLLASLDILGALGLIRFYEQEDHYLIKLQSPLDRESFLANGVFRSLLSSRIGEVAVEQLTMTLPTAAVDKTKRFSEVFTDRGEVYYQPQQAEVDFKLDNFKELMAREGQIRFADERLDVIGLYTLSDQYKKTWFDLYQLAKDTATPRFDKHGIKFFELSIDRLRTKLESFNQKPETNLNDAEQALITVAKSHKPLDFLMIYKGEKNGFVTEEEKTFINLLARRGLLDEVINILMFYTLQRTKTGNVNREYLLKVVNDFLYKQISTAEQALAHFKREKTIVKTERKPSKTNVPEWSNPDYKETVTEEEQLALERQMDELLAQLDEEE